MDQAVKSGLSEPHELARVRFGFSSIEKALVPCGSISAKMPAESLDGFARKAGRLVLRQPGFGLIFVGEPPASTLKFSRVVSVERRRPSAASVGHSRRLLGFGLGFGQQILNVRLDRREVAAAHSPSPDGHYFLFPDQLVVAALSKTENFLCIAVPRRRGSISSVMIAAASRLRIPARANLSTA